MAERTREAGEAILGVADAVAEQVVDLVYAARPDLPRRYGPAGRVHCLADMALPRRPPGRRACSQRAPALFTDYVAWTKVILARRGIAEQDLLDTLGALAAPSARC